MQGIETYGHKGGALTRLAIWAPLLIVGYTLALLALRVSLSTYLEVDEAQFVGNVDIRLVYANSHPPLYNWVLRAMLEASNWDWAFSTGIVKYGLLGGFYLLTWDTARRLGGREAGLVAVAAAAFMPQVSWMSVHTLAHSTMVLTGTAATLHAFVLLTQKCSTFRYAWFGFALGLGALAKYNFFLFAIPLLVAILWSGELRTILWRRKAAISLGVFSAMFAPTMVAAILNFAASSGRMEKLYRADKDLVWYDVPGLGVDGLLSLATASAAWLGLAIAVWGIARWRDARDGAQAYPDPDTVEIRRCIGRAILLAICTFALIVLAADMHRVHERYLTPIFAAAPVLMSVSWPLGRSALNVTRFAGTLFFAALVGFWGMASFGTHRYAYDYDAIAAEIAELSPNPAPILAARHDDGANATLALGWEGTTSPRFQTVGDRAILLWRGTRDAPVSRIPEGFEPATGVHRFKMTLSNFSGKRKAFAIQLYERVSP